jgi:uncharacterized protein YaeQ
MALHKFGLRAFNFALCTLYFELFLLMLSATIYSFETELSDVDRGVYESFSVRLARHPSETPEFMVTRFLAYCLEYTEGITLTEGVSAGDEPAVLVRDLTGRITAWIEVGMPEASKLHRGSKLAGRAAVYTHRNIAKVLEELSGSRIHQASQIPIYEFGRGFIDQVAGAIERREQVTMSINERQLHLDLSGRAYSTDVVEHRLT